MYDVTNFSKKRRTILLSLLVCLVVALFTDKLQFPSNFEKSKIWICKFFLTLDINSFPAFLSVRRGQSDSELWNYIV